MHEIWADRERESDGDRNPIEIIDLEAELEKHRRRNTIRCPRCAWEPERDDLWACSCFHVWNTFETGGQCPACSTQWRDTQCLSCHEWSPHVDWYVTDDQDST